MVACSRHGEHPSAARVWPPQQHRQQAGCQHEHRQAGTPRFFVHLYPRTSRQGRMQPLSYYSCTQAVGGQPCVIRAYVAEYLNYEFPYLFDRVLGGVLGACSCYLRVLPRTQLLHDTNISHALIVSGTNGDAWPSFAADMAATRGWADLKTLGLVHLGDEHLSDDVSGYPDFAFVLRNYLREDLPHGAQVPLSSQF